MSLSAGSLVGKGAELDGATSGGAGVEFSTAYFAAFFDDFIAERDRSQTATATATSTPAAGAGAASKKTR